ncbi:MAG: restriction endonuclease subunit S [Candidatus Eisenbacteria bacterium]|uniref:Restriction endonuclease subunit S n=1 Tax=Eiseniibacteriota bacterium TaxID=2212470 RepID=A0A956NHU2_UNCEI|nr:restriction endonuclease subunit S [Candidatus Eisenbacteria bacterium]
MSAVSETTARIESPERRPLEEVRRGYSAFLRGDVLIAKITPCFENGKVAHARDLPEEVGFGSTEFHVIRPTSEVDGGYLYHLLRAPQVRLWGEGRMKGAAGQRRVPSEFLSALEIPLPPLEEQKRIARILDEADALRAKRRESIEQLDTLLQSTFLDMFGDPVAAGWPTATVADLAGDHRNAIRTGPFGSQLLHSEFVDEGIQVLGIDNVVSNEFRAETDRFITREKYRSLERYKVHPRDVLITIMGTCGRCAVVPDTIVEAINTKHLCCISLNPSKCVPEFLHSYFLLHPIARKYLARSAKGAIMSGLNMGIIKSLPVPVVPIHMQREFARLTATVRTQKSHLRAHLAELDTLFASLQSRAFSGEL